MSQHESKKVSRRGALAASLGAAAGFGMVAAGGQASAKPRKWRSLAGKKVLVAIGEFSEGLETYYMVFRLQEEGITPVVVAAQVKNVQLVVHDMEDQYTNYTEKLGYFIPADIAWDDVDPSDYHGLLIPGGRGGEEMRQYPEALDVVGYFLDNNLPLGAMCHGQQAIWAARPVKKRKMTSYYGIRADLELAGAEFVDAPAVTDRAMVTSRGWPDLAEFMPAFLDVLAKG